MRREFEEDALLTPVYESMFEGFSKCKWKQHQSKQNRCIDDALNKTKTQDLHAALTMPFTYTTKHQHVLTAWIFKTGFFTRLYQIFQRAQHR